MLHYPEEDTIKLFAKLPDLLRETMLSEETAANISKIAEKNSLSKKYIPHLAELVGYILLGLLPPQNLPKILEKDFNIQPETSETIAREINRFILYPVKNELSEFYKEIEFAPRGKIIKAEKKEKINSLEKMEGGVSSTQDQKRQVQDLYREPIE